MRIVAELVERDYWEYNKHTMLTHPGKRNAFLINFAGIHVTIFMMMMILKEPLIYCLLYAVFIGLLADLVVILLFRSRVKKAAESGRGIIGKHIFEITETGIKDETGVHRTSFLWEDVTAVESDQNSIYIFIGEHFGLIIPVRAVETVGGKEDFLNEIRKHWGK